MAEVPVRPSDQIRFGATLERHKQSINGAILVDQAHPSRLPSGQHLAVPLLGGGFEQTEGIVSEVQMESTTLPFQQDCITQLRAGYSAGPMAFSSDWTPT
jgi:hypothetical protein